MVSVKYELVLYPTGYKDHKPQYADVPRVGDLLRVASIEEGVRDFHWGECIVARLERVPIKEQSNESKTG